MKFENIIIFKSCLSLALGILNYEVKQSDFRAFEVTGEGGVSKMLDNETKFQFF